MPRFHLGIFIYLLEGFGFVLALVFFTVFFARAFLAAVSVLVLPRTAFAELLPSTFSLIESVQGTAAVRERFFFSTFFT